MSLLAERFTRTAEPEEPQMTTPRPRLYGVPWWLGVTGLDPLVPVYDWEVAARHSALACSLQAFGPDAVYRAGGLMAFGKAATSPNLRMRAWLLDGVMTPEAAERRRYALRLAVDHGAGLKVDDLLEMAQDFADALRPG